MGSSRMQHVRLVEQDEHELQAALLPTGQVLDGRGELLRGEAEPLEQLRRRHLLAVGDVARLLAGDDLAHAVVGELLQVGELLVEHRDLHRLAGLHPPARRLQPPGDQVEQRRLAGAVRAEDAGPLPRCDPPLDAVEDLRAVERDAHVEQVDDVLAEARGRRPRQRDGVADRRDVVDQGVRRVDAELRLARAGRGAAAQPRELLAGQVLAALLDRGRLPVTLDALQDVRRVATFEGVDDAVVDLPRVGRHRVEEPPVVRHDDHAALVRRPAAVDVLGEPLDALDVQVVGRLVEEQDVPVADQQPRECHTATLPTGQLVDADVPRDVRDETADDVADLRVTGPLVLLEVADDGAADGRALGQDVALVQVADGQPAAVRDAAAVGLEALGQQREEGRLAVAVPADDADPVTLVDAEGDVVEDDLGGELEMQVLGAEEMCHASRVGGAAGWWVRGGWFGWAGGSGRTVRACSSGAGLPRSVRACSGTRSAQPRTSRQTAHGATARRRSARRCDGREARVSSRERRRLRPRPPWHASGGPAPPSTRSRARARRAPARYR